MLWETKSKSKKFRIPWSKVLRVLEPLKSSYGHFSQPVGHGRFKPKNTQNGNKSRFPGATCIFSKCCDRQNRRARNPASDGQKYRAFWSPESRVMEISVTRRRNGRFKPKNTQNGNKSRFPGATCIFSKWCERQNRRARNSASDGQKYRAFWSPENRDMAILVTRRATAVSSRKTPKMAINRDFPGLRAFSANVARDKIEEQEIPHPMVKSTARFGAPKIELWPF